MISYRNPLGVILWPENVINYELWKMRKLSELLTGVVLFIAGIALLGGGVYLLKDKMELVV